jgi:hypothetical protein
MVLKVLKVLKENMVLKVLKVNMVPQEKKEAMDL